MEIYKKSNGLLLGWKKIMITKDKDEEEEKAKYFLFKQVKDLQAEVKSLKTELKRVRRIPSGKIGIALLVPGVSSLFFSILQESQILAFIGLSLTFWGALFFFVKPVKYIRSDLLSLAELPSYSTIDRILKDLRFRSGIYYIPPYPSDVYLPEHLKGLKEITVFISSDKNPSMPSIEDLARKKFLLKNLKGVCISPPGLSILIQIEKEIGNDLTTLDLNTFLESLPDIATSSLHVAEKLEIKSENNTVYLKASGSIYADLYTRKDLASVRLLGCPLISAIACALAKTTGRVVMIKECNAFNDGQIIEAWYKLVEE